MENREFDNDYIPHRPKRKNTKKWCKGVVGREHVFVVRNWAEYKRWTWVSDWSVEVCSNCGKEGKWGYRAITLANNLGN